MYVNYYDMHNAYLYKYTYTLLLNLIITYTTTNLIKKQHTCKLIHVYMYVTKYIYIL